MTLHKALIFLFITTYFFSAQAQEIKKENMTKIVHFYYDYNKIQSQSSGHYYKDDLGETTEKHGKWSYYDRYGELQEVRNYYRDNLQGQVILYFSNKKKKTEGYFKFGKQDSTYREWNELGNLVTEGTYSFDKPVGKWIYYYRDGRVKSVENVIDGVNLLDAFYLPDSLHTQTLTDGNGELSTFYTTGALKEYYLYKDGLRNGEFLEYSIYGYPTLTGEFKKGEKEGEWKYAYYTGDKEKISHYKNGVLDGEYNYFYDTGQLNVKGQYENGEKTGAWNWYTNSGKKDQEGYFLNDMQDGKWRFYFPDEQVSYSAEFKKGKRHGFWAYFYKDGSKFKEGNFADDKKDGDWKTWYESGQLLMEGKYANGKEEGEWKNYWENGQLKNKSTFRNGLLNGDWESHHKKGVLSLKGDYRDNNKTGEWTSYYENGRPKEVITYKIITTKSKINYSIMKDRVRTDSERHGKYVSYSQKDYKLLETGSYKDGEKDGEWISYHPGGKTPAVISNFKKGELNGIQKQFDRRGNIVSSIEYKDGLRDGKFLGYNKKGKVIVEKRYKDGMQVIEGSATGTGFDPN